MVEFDGTVEVVGPDGPVPFLDLFQGRDELVVYKHIWYDGAPHQRQCEGCTTTAWHLNADYLNTRGVSFAILTTGRWDKVASYVEFMGYTQPWYSVRDVDAPVGAQSARRIFARDSLKAVAPVDPTPPPSSCRSRAWSPEGGQALLISCPWSVRERRHRGGSRWLPMRASGMPAEASTGMR